MREVVVVEHVLGMGAGNIGENLIWCQRLLGSWRDCPWVEPVVEANPEPGGLSRRVGAGTVDEFQQQLLLHGHHDRRKNQAIFECFDAGGLVPNTPTTSRTPLLAAQSPQNATEHHTLAPHF